MLLQCLTAPGSLAARDLGRLHCTARCFPREVVDDAACQILAATAHKEAHQRVEFEDKVEAAQIITLEAQQRKADDLDFSFPLDQKTIVRFWGDSEPDETDISELRNLCADVRRELAAADLLRANTLRRKAAVVANASQEPLARVTAARQRDERWLQMLHRTERFLAFTEFGNLHSAEVRLCAQIGGRVSCTQGRWTTPGGWPSTAVCAQHLMTAGVHRAEFSIDGEQGRVAVGVVMEVYGRPANHTSGWFFSSRGLKQHNDAFTEFPGGEEFGPGDTIRMELDLSGEWGGHVIAREGNKIKTAPRLGPATKATLRAFKNGEYLGEVAIIQKDPDTGFYWVVEMHGDEALTWVEISRPDAR